MNFSHINIPKGVWPKARAPSSKVCDVKLKIIITINNVIKQSHQFHEYNGHDYIKVVLSLVMSLNITHIHSFKRVVKWLSNKVEKWEMHHNTHTLFVCVCVCCVQLYGQIIKRHSYLFKYMLKSTTKFHFKHRPFTTIPIIMHEDQKLV